MPFKPVAARNARGDGAIKVALAGSRRHILPAFVIPGLGLNGRSSDSTTRTTPERIKQKALGDGSPGPPALFPPYVRCRTDRLGQKWKM